MHEKRPRKRVKYVACNAVHAGTVSCQKAVVRCSFTAEYTFSHRQETTAGLPSMVGGTSATQKDAGSAVLRRQTMLLVTRRLLLS